MVDLGPLPAFTQETIQAIWSAHRFGPVTQTAKLPGGVRNLCFLVNGCLVLRVNSQDPGSLKFHNERLAYDRLVGQSLPVPRVLVLDDSHELVPYDFMITTRLPGQSLASSWHQLSDDRLQAPFHEIGQCLARVHSCTFPACGRLHALDHASWADLVYENVEPLLRTASHSQLLDPALRAAVERSLKRVREDLEGVQPALIHCDCHYENVLHDGGHLSGLLDFEWALAGDPSYDFAIPHVRERQVPGSEAALIAGYQCVREFDAGHPHRVRCYRMISQLEQAIAHDRLGERKGLVAALRRLRQLLEPVGP
jgi:Ser/Thr protein kinase RdoA (MazF antagonist)